VGDQFQQQLRVEGSEHRGRQAVIMHENAVAANEISAVPCQVEIEDWLDEAGLEGVHGTPGQYPRLKSWRHWMGVLGRLAPDFMQPVLFVSFKVAGFSADRIILLVTKSGISDPRGTRGERDAEASDPRPESGWALDKARTAIDRADTHLRHSTCEC